MVFGGLNCYAAIETRALAVEQRQESRKLFGGDLEFCFKREEIKMSRTHKPGTMSRGGVLRASAGLAGGPLVPREFTLADCAVGARPAIGTYPAGSQGDTIN